MGSRLTRPKDATKRPALPRQVTPDFLNLPCAAVPHAVGGARGLGRRDQGGAPQASLLKPAAPR